MLCPSVNYFVAEDPHSGPDPAFLDHCPNRVSLRFPHRFGKVYPPGNLVSDDHSCFDHGAFPQMTVHTPKILHFIRIFHDKPSILGITHGPGPNPTSPRRT